MITINSNGEPLSAEFLSTIGAPSRTFAARLLLNGDVLGGALKGLVIHKGTGNTDEGFTVGTVFSSYIECSIDNLQTAIDGEELELQIGLVLPDESVEYITVGYYTATKVKKTTYRTNFVGVGRIASKLNVSFVPPEVQTVASVAAAIGSSAGITVSLQGISGSTTALTTNLSNFTCYEVLQILAGVTGGYATETAGGEVLLAAFGSGSTVATSAERMIALPSFAENDFAVQSVKVIVQESTDLPDGTSSEEISFVYPAGTVVPSLTVTNPFMTEALFEDCFAENVVGYTFRAADVPLTMGDPRLEAPDILAISADGSTYSVPCHTMLHRFDGGVNTEIISADELEKDDGFAAQRPLASLFADVSAASAAAASALETAEGVADRANSGEFTSTLLRVDSSRGTAFKNADINTVLSAVIFYGSEQVSDISALHAIFGDSAYLQWQWQGYNSSTWHIIAQNDSRLGNNGFTLTLSPSDVDIKAVFSCSLIV